MGLREKVALTLIVALSLEITSTVCMSKSRYRNNLIRQSKKPAQIVYPAQSAIDKKSKLKQMLIRPQDRSKCDVRGPKSVSVYEKFQFPENEYPLLSPNSQNLLTYKTKCGAKNIEFRPNKLPNITIPFLKKNNKINCKYSSNPDNRIIEKKTSASPDIFKTQDLFCFQQNGAFPDVDYPLDVRETWKPNYWKQLPDTCPNLLLENAKQGDSKTEFKKYLKPNDKAIEKAIQALIKSKQNPTTTTLSPSDAVCTSNEMNNTTSNLEIPTVPATTTYLLTSTSTTPATDISITTPSPYSTDNTESTAIPLPYQVTPITPAVSNDNDSNDNENNPLVKSGNNSKEALDYELDFTTIAPFITYDTSKVLKPDNDSSLLCPEDGDYIMLASS